MRERDAVADSYNARAVREGWPVVCDASLSFLRPEFRRLLDFWHAAAGPGGIPKRRDITHRSLKELLARVAIYERATLLDHAVRYRVRLIGTEFAEIMGNLTGRFLDEALPAPFLPRWLATLDASLDAGAPLRFLSRTDTTGKSFLIAEYFEAPLLSDSGERNLILGAAYFSRDKNWSERVAAETGNRIAAH